MAEPERRKPGGGAPGRNGGRQVPVRDGDKIGGGDHHRVGDLFVRGKFVRVPQEGPGVKFKVHHTIPTGCLGGSFLAAGAAGRCGDRRGAAGGRFGHDLLLAEAESQGHVLHRHKGDEDKGEAGSCKAAEHLVRKIGGSAEMSILRAGVAAAGGPEVLGPDRKRGQGGGFFPKR